MLGEFVDRIATYGTAGYVFIKPIFEKMFKHPELTKIVTEKLANVAKGGKTRADELIFFASLVSLSGPDATRENKELFLKKHYELCSPDITGKTPAQIAELRKKEALAKGLVFLISENHTTTGVGGKLHLANQIWYGIFMGINDRPNDATKLALLEERILHFGKNNQEKKSVGEIIEKITPYAKSTWTKIDSIADSIGDGIGKATTWIEDQYDKKQNRAAARRAKIAANNAHIINPLMWFEWFRDQF